MKRLLSSLLIVMTAILIASAQEVVIGTYHDSDGAKEHKVAVRLKDNGTKVDCAFIFVSSTMGGGYFRIDGKKIPEFVNALTDVRDKLEEWSCRAKENDIKAYTKKIDADFPKVVVYLSGRANFNFTQKPTALFEVRDGKPCVWIYTNTLTNFTKYTNQKTVFSMVFENPADINGLISMLRNEETMLRLSQDKLQDEKKIDDLFN